MKRLFLLLPIVALISCGGSAPKENPSASKIDQAKTQEVFDRHFKDFKENNLDGIIADYAEDATLITPNGTYTGLTEIKANFEQAFKLFPKDSSTYETIQTVVKNDIAYTIWKCKTPKLELSFATDTFIIQDGKIVRQTFAGQ